MPVSGQTRYRDGRECLGLGSVTIRASDVALEGRMKILDGISDWGGNVILEDDGWDFVEVFESAGAALVDRVLAIVLVGGD
jgi:hypothetical protein